MSLSPLTDPGRDRERARARTPARARALVALLLLLGLPLASCGGDDQAPARVVVHLLFPDGTDPLVGTSSLTVTFHKPSVDTFIEEVPDDVGTLPELVFSYSFPGETAVTATVEVTAEDLGGIVRARGRSVRIELIAGMQENVGVLMLFPGQFAVGPESMRLETARTLHGAASVGDNGLLVAGGTTEAGVTPTLELFDMRAFDALPAPPQMPTPRSRFAMTALNADQVLMIGGVVSMTHADLFDGLESSYAVLDLPAEVPAIWKGPRIVPMGDGSAIVLGGLDADDGIVGVAVRATADSLTVLDGTVTRENPTVTRIDHPDGVRLLLYGGNAPGVPPGALLDPATGTIDEDWDSPDDARTRHAAVRTGGGKVIVLGGVGPTGDPATHAYILDPACYDRTAGCMPWSDAGPTLSSGPFLDAVAVAVDPDAGDPRALFGCGVDVTEAPMQDAVLISADVGTARRIRLVAGRSGCSITRLQTGQIAIIGGIADDGTPLDTVEFLEPPAR